MPEENTNQEFRLKIFLNFLIEEINQNKLISKKYKPLWGFE